MDLRRWTLSALVSKATGEVDFYVNHYEIYRASFWKALSVAQTDAGEGLKLGRLGAGWCRAATAAPMQKKFSSTSRPPPWSGPARSPCAYGCRAWAPTPP